MLLVLIALAVLSGVPNSQQKSAPKAAPFTTPYSLAEMTGKQAVVETSKGTFVFELLPKAAPNHVGFFMKQARDGAFAGTTFHRVIKYGIIQGGDPISHEPAQAAQYEALGYTPESAHDLILARFDYSFSVGALVAMVVVILLYYFLILRFSDIEYREVISEKFGQK